MWTKAFPILAAHAAFAWSSLLFADNSGFAVPLTVIQADPHRPGTLLAGTATAQLFRSRDGGDTWSPLSFPGALRTNLHALLIDPDRAGVYLAAVSSETAGLAGAWRSRDDGATWEQIPGLES